MPTPISQLVGVEFPLFAFSHCRDVVAAVSRAGGFGVLGGSSFTPESLELELKWIDEHVDGKPYGVDLVVPENVADTPGMSVNELLEQVPANYRDFIVDLLKRHDITPSDDLFSDSGEGFDVENGERLMDVAFQHPIRMIANALGIAPQAMLDRGRKYGVPVAALVGAKEHAVRQVKAGVDFLVAQGTEAGGHCGEVSTLVLVPEVIKAIKPIREVPVLAAGGIVTGRQMAGCMAMGAAGAWTGSVWLATPESETSPVFREKMLAASSRDTVRSKYRTGKPSRQLRSRWHDEWDAAGLPALPMLTMVNLSGPIFAAIDRAAEAGNSKARDLVSYWVGQGVGLIDAEMSATGIVQEFKEDFAEAVMGLNAAVEE